MTALPNRTRTDLAPFGSPNPALAGKMQTELTREGNFFRLDFTLNAVSIPVTDGTTSGSHGSLKLFDFEQQAISFLGCRQNYTLFTEGAALSGGAGAGDAAFEIGIGTTAISAAADGTLGNGVNENVGQAISVDMAVAQAGTAVDYGRTAIDGTTTAVDLNLNFSGTAATVDANSTLAVTGTITVIGVFMGDD